VAEVVHPELHLDALPGAGLVDRHQPGVVDEQVEPARLGRGERGDAVEVGQVQRAHRDRRGRGALADGDGGRFGLRRVAAGQHDLGPVRGEAVRNLEPQSGVGSGDDRAAAGEIRDVSGYPAHESYSDLR
jgi:hypothetical protein